MATEPTMVNIHEAKTHLSRLLARVAAGEEIVIAKAGEPVARLVPVKPRRPDRVLGLDRGRIWMAPDCWDPMTDEEIAEWEDGKVFPGE